MQNFEGKGICFFENLKKLNKMAMFTGIKQSGKRILVRCTIQRLQINSIHTDKRDYAYGEVLQETVPTQIPFAGPRPFNAIPQDYRVPVLSFIKDIYDAFTGELSKLHVREYKQYLKHGSIFLEQIGPAKTVIISDPDVVAEVCRQEVKLPRRQEGFERGLKAIRDSRRRNGFNVGLLALENEEWRRVRSLLQKAILPPQVVKNYFDGFDDVAHVVAQELKATQDQNGTVQDIVALVQKWALESFCTFSLGKRMNLFSNNPDKELVEFFTSIESYVDRSMILSQSPMMKYLLPSKHRALEEATVSLMKNGKDIVMKTISEAKDGSQTQEGVCFEKSFLAYLMQKEEVTPEEAVIHAIDTLLGAVDTTSCATSWLIYLLARNPDVQEKLHEEVCSVLPADGKVTYDALQKMPYLRACMKEQGRLYPVGIHIPRAYPHDIEAAGYTIPAYTIVSFANYIMGKREDLFPDPLAFRPERWLRPKGGSRDKTELPHVFSSLQFGHGPRSCLGRRVAEAEMQTLLTHLVKNFKFSHTGKPIDSEVKFLLRMSDRFDLTLEERKE